MKELEIRPKEVFDEYLRISAQDIKVFFSNHNKFVEVSCPGCNGQNTELSFKKCGFSYRICKNCLTLFVSPRPTQKMINDFYKQSASSKFWAERFFPETAEARRAKIFQPRAKMISDFIAKSKLPKPLTLVDVGSGFGIFLEEIKKINIFDELIGIEPNMDLVVCCKDKGFKVIEKPVELVKSQEINVSVACSFEVFEHLFDPEEFLESMSKLLKPGGLIYFTTLTISGLDLQVLWQDSKSISPPHHINFLSIEGLRNVIKRCGLEEIEISTPGQLDVDIIRNTMKEIPDIKVPRFIDYIINNRDQKTSESLQKFLQDNLLSSHARVIAQKT